MISELRSTKKFVIIDKETGVWELNFTENQLAREYLSKGLCIYHVWESIEGTMEELKKLNKKYPIIYADQITIIPEEKNNVPF